MTRVTNREASDLRHDAGFDAAPVFGFFAPQHYLSIICVEEFGQNRSLLYYDVLQR